MDFKTFKEEVKENVRAHLPKEAKDVELSFGTYQKMNYSYEALFINIPEKNAQVSINLDELYEAFVEDADRLTDEVYHFDTKDRVFEKVDKFVARQKENSQKHVAEKGTEGIQKPKKSHEMSL